MCGMATQRSPDALEMHSADSGVQASGGRLALNPPSSAVARPGESILRCPYAVPALGQQAHLRADRYSVGHGARKSVVGIALDRD